MAHIHISSDRLSALLQWEEGLDLEQVTAELESQGIRTMLLSLELWQLRRAKRRCASQGGVNRSQEMPQGFS